MIPILALNPFLGVAIATILQTSVLVGYIFNVPDRFNRAQVAEKSRTRFLWHFLEDFGAGIFLLFGVLLLDIAILWGLGAWTYADWRFQLPSVILLAVLGVQYILRPLRIKHHRWRFLFTGITVAILVIFLHCIISGLAIMGVLLETYLPVLLGALVVAALVIGLVHAVLGRKRSGQDSKEVISNVTPRIARIFTPPVNIILWVLAVGQCIFVFLGYSWFSLG